MPAPQAYSRSQVWLHWIVAALVVVQYVFKDAISTAWVPCALALRSALTR